LRFTTWLARLNLGADRCAVQDPLREALTLGVDLGDKHLVASCLEDAAAVEAARDATRAATLVGAEELGAPADDERSEEVRAVAGDAYEHAYAEGRSQSPECAVAYALASLD
jgi:hypothetical protein